MPEDKSAIRFLRLPEVMHLTGLSRSSVYRRIAEGKFPASRVYLGQVGTFWTSVEIERWQADQVGAGVWECLSEVAQPEGERDKTSGMIVAADGMKNVAVPQVVEERSLLPEMLRSPEIPLMYDLLMTIKPRQLTASAWLAVAGVNRSWLYDVRRGVAPRTDTLEKVVEAAGLTMRRFFELRESNECILNNKPFGAACLSAENPPGKLLRLGGLKVGAVINESDLVEFLEMHYVVDGQWQPTALLRRKDVYLLKVAGHSMAPKFDDGDPVYVDPRRQPSAGEYVLVRLKRNDHPIGLLKKMVRRTSEYIELGQLQPAVTFQVPVQDIDAVHRVIPWREIVFE